MYVSTRVPANLISVLLVQSGRRKETKSPGSDNLNPKVLNELANEVGPLLLLIYRKSLQTSEVSEDRRKANLAPVFKKGQRYQAENYGPVSLSSACCKIMEHIVAAPS